MEQDRKLKEEIVSHILLDSRLEGSLVDVEVREGLVILRGRVGSSGQLKAAMEDAMAVEGVRNLENGLEVSEEPLADLPSDLVIRKQLTSKLVKSASVMVSRLDVAVYEGIVTLRGVVRSYDEKVEAEEMSSSTEGVIRVINLLVIVPSADPLDIAVAERIVDELGNDPQVPVHSFDLKVIFGKVTMSGTVQSGQMRDRVEECVSGIVGVMGVENRLLVRTFEEE
ncbi:osmotically inducible protein OsmY [Chitinispirillum alkaliphilum]|nr:osmotically inducible protein OsmY [Chitinispirillum alkaliphilum]